MSQPTIQTINLTHRYGAFAAIQNVNLSINENEIFGFLGPNGAGKTTAIRTILDFIRPTEGTVQVFGLDSRRDSLQIRHRLSYLPSELKLWENWTGEGYIRWLEKVHKQPLMDEAQRLAERLEYDLKHKLSGLSTGMKRKMGLIAALAPKKELLILDEPTTGLDPLMQQVFNDIMQEVRSEGRTVFLSSHNLQEVEQICDRVGIIRHGQLEAVQSIAGLTQVSFRWLTVEVEGQAAQNGFLNINGISDVTINGNQLRMRVSGDTNIDKLVKHMANFTIKDLRFEHPTLEEVFLAYYGGNTPTPQGGQ